MTDGLERTLAETFEHGRATGVVVRVEFLDTEADLGVEKVRLTPSTVTVRTSVPIPVLGVVDVV